MGRNCFVVSLDDASVEGGRGGMPSMSHESSVGVVNMGECLSRNNSTRPPEDNWVQIGVR